MVKPIPSTQSVYSMTAPYKAPALEERQASSSKNIDVKNTPLPYPANQHPTSGELRLRSRWASKKEGQKADYDAFAEDSSVLSDDFNFDAAESNASEESSVALMRESQIAQSAFDDTLFKAALNARPLYEEKPLVINHAVANDVILYAALTHTVFSGTLQNNLKKADEQTRGSIINTWKPLLQVPDELMKQFSTMCVGLKKHKDGRLLAKSGLVMQIFENETSGKVVLAFGGTTSGATKGALPRRMLSLNTIASFTQWDANLNSAFGIRSGKPVPDSYKEASDMTAASLEHYEGWDISVTGHSKGGAEAEYSAIKNRVKAVCFDAPELGVALLRSFKTEELEWGRENITHYFVDGDIVPHVVSQIVGEKNGVRPSHVGQGYELPADPTACDGGVCLKPLLRHNQFLTSALYLKKLVS